MDGKKAIIIGGSIGGLFAAHQLRAIGWQADIYERNQHDLSDRGAGLGTHFALYEAMKRAGIEFDAGEYTSPSSYVCLDHSGRIIYEKPGHGRRMTSWARLYHPLRHHFPEMFYHRGMSLVTAETRDGKAVARFENNTEIAADLLIGADGVRSTVRQGVLPLEQPVYAGYVAWRVLVPQSRIPRQTWDFIKDRYVYVAPEGEFVLSYPVPTPPGSTELGEKSFNIVWYRPVALANLRELLTDAAGREHAHSIPPPLIRQDIVNAFRADARQSLPVALNEVIQNCEHPFFHPIYDCKSSALVFGRVILLGDAAFTPRPHPGAGVTKAALDAMCLADSIQRFESLDAALENYNSSQLGVGTRVFARSAAMGAPIRARPAGAPPPTQEQLEQRTLEILEDYTSISSTMFDPSNERLGAS